MSIQALNDLYLELNRLTIAGVNLAKNDYRINKLIPIFKKSGESVAVFNKVALLTEKLINEEEENRSAILLELLNISIAILSTQGKTSIDGETEVLTLGNREITTEISYRKLKPVINALLGNEGGRLAVIEEGFKEGIFNDIRTIIPLVKAVTDAYHEISDFAFKRLREFGITVVPILKKSINLTDVKGTVKKIELVSDIAKEKENNWYLQFLQDDNHDEIMAAAIGALKHNEENLPVVVEYTYHKKKAIRQAAYTTLGFYKNDKVIDIFYKAFDDKDRNVIKYGLEESKSPDLIKYIISKIKDSLQRLLDSKELTECISSNTHLPYQNKDVSLIYDSLEIINSLKDKVLLQLYLYLKDYMKEMNFMDGPKNNSFATVSDKLVDNLLLFDSTKTYSVLSELLGKCDNKYIDYSFVAYTKISSPKEVYNVFANIVKRGKGNQEALKIIDLFYYLALSQKKNNLVFKFSDSYKNLDSRWLDVFVELDIYEVIVFLKELNIKVVSEYLITRIKKNMKDGKPISWNDIDVLLSIDNKQGPKLVLEVLELALKDKKYFYFESLKMMPKKYASDIEKLGKKYQENKLIEIANDLKNK